MKTENLTPRATLTLDAQPARLSAMWMSGSCPTTLK